MKDNQKKYLDKVVSLLVRDTTIDYEQEKIITPYLSFLLSFPFPHNMFLPTTSFSKYCKDTYGLGKNEIEYVWYQYKDIIKEKI